MGTDHTSMN